MNIYVVVGPDGLTVIDSGWAGVDSRRALDSALSELGHHVSDIEQFVVTHAHWDHYTQALALRSEFGTPVRIGAEERHSIDVFDLADGAYPEQARRLIRCGAADLAALVLAIEVSEIETTMPFGRPDSWLRDEDKIAIGDRTLQVLATPGHTRGHIVLRDENEGVLFAGDHVLPHITPSIGLERAPEPAPLRSYLASLRLVRDRADLVLLPAHGLPSPSTHTRIDELLRHHEQRLAAIAARVAAGHRDAFTVAGQIGWTRRSRRLDELDLIIQMMAVLEVQAHLDVLVAAGEVALVVDDRDVDSYTVR